MGVWCRRTLPQKEKKWYPLMKISEWNFLNVEHLPGHTSVNNKLLSGNETGFLTGQK